MRKSRLSIGLVICGVLGLFIGVQPVLSEVGAVPAEQVSSGTSDGDFEFDGVEKVYRWDQRSDVSGPPWEYTEIESDNKVVYGADDRIDVYEEIDAVRLSQAASTCGLFGSGDITDNGNGTFTIQTQSYSQAYNLCPQEPFYSQPIAAFCTGFLVGPDLIATAGHCFDVANLGSTQFVFGFEMADASTPILTLSDDYKYTGVELVGRALGGGLDYAVVRVDRTVVAPGAQALDIRRSGTVPNGTSIGVIGHPAGLPKKIAFGAQTQVYDNSASGSFEANLDTYGGNSGSPVFNSVTGVVEGILVNGATDYVSSGNCWISNQLPDSSADEGVSKSTTFAQFIPVLASSQGTIRLDEAYYGCTDTATVTVTDSDESGTVSVTVTSQNGDSETVVLTELVSTAGVFVGTISISDSGVVVNNGTLNIVDGTLVTASYLDADDGGGSPANVSDTATIDCSGPPDPLTELFALGHDLANKTLTFTPDISQARYQLCVEAAAQFPTATGGGTSIGLNDDSYTEVALQNGKTVVLFGVAYSSVYIGTNGYLTFGAGDFGYIPSASAHFNIPRVSALFDDLNPSAAGDVNYEQFSDRFVVSYEGVPEYGGVNPNNVQVEMYFDGVISITYLTTTASGALVGLSDGGGTPTGFVSSDLSAELNCAPVSVMEVILIRDLFNLMDQDKDGLLSFGESFLVLDAFNFLDTSGDGFLSMEELLDYTVGSSGSAVDVYVDFAFSGTESGTSGAPFNSVGEGVGFVSAGGDVHLKPGSSSEVMTISKPVVLKRDGVSGVVRIGSQP